MGGADEPIRGQRGSVNGLWQLVRVVPEQVEQRRCVVERGAANHTAVGSASHQSGLLEPWEMDVVHPEPKRSWVDVPLTGDSFDARGL